MNDWRMYSDGTKEDREGQAWHEVLRAIAELNGSTHTLVHAAYGEHVDLVVAGGNDGLVLVQWKEYEPQEQHYILSTLQSAGLMKHLTIEGAEATYPNEWCVPLEQAIPVCGDLLRTCERPAASNLTWLRIE